jgi:stage III sporulation protein AE
MALILAVMILCGVALSFTDNHELVALAGVLTIAVTSVSGLSGVLSGARNAINDMNAFVNLLLPVLAGAGTVMGMPTAFFARQTATVFFSGLLSSLISSLLLPMLYAYVALITANAAAPRELLGRLAGLIKWLFCSVLGLTLAAFIAYLTISGTIAGSADAVADKGAKAAISGAVPVVGGIISDAAETLLAGAGIIKNTIGIFGLLAVLGIALTPFLQLGARVLVFKLTAALSSVISGERLSSYVDQLSSAFSLALAMTASCTLMVVISVISCIQAGVGG